MKLALPLALFLPLCGLLPSCFLFGLSHEEENHLASYRMRAKRYFDAGDLARALDQTSRGLRVAADDYQLLSTRAMCFLSRGQKTKDSADLLRAEQVFERIMPYRSTNEHDPRTFLGYGLTLHRLGANELIRAQLLRDENRGPARNEDEVSDPIARAEEHERRSRAYYKSAETQLLKLIEVGSHVPLANKHIMHIKISQNDYEAAVRFGEASLAQNAQDMDYWQKRYEQTGIVQYEKQTQLELQQLREAEREVRAELSRQHRKHKNYPAAIGQLDAILKLDPSQSDAYYSRGICYRALGKQEEAKRDFTKFLRTNSLPPGNKYVQDAYRYTYGSK